MTAALITLKHQFLKSMLFSISSLNAPLTLLYIYHRKNTWRSLWPSKVEATNFAPVLHSYEYCPSHLSPGSNYWTSTLGGFEAHALGLSLTPDFPITFPHIY